MKAGYSIRRFAKEAGVEIVAVGPGWNGRWGFKAADYPNCVTAGFKTKSDAYRAWAVETFGERAATALFDLLGERA